MSTVKSSGRRRRGSKCPLSQTQRSRSTLILHPGNANCTHTDKRAIKHELHNANPSLSALPKGASINDVCAEGEGESYEDSPNLQRNGIESCRGFQRQRVPRFRNFFERHMWETLNDTRLPSKLVNGSRVGQVGPVDSCGQVGDLDPSFVKSRSLSRF